jgi:hypothetical protein
MGLLKEAEMEQAFAKIGILGFAGTGKSFTAGNISLGICKRYEIDRIAFFDTETGSDFLLAKFKANGIKMVRVKSRSFSDLMKTIKECEESGVQILIIDSITHVWRDLVESYDKKLNRGGRLQFQDWNIIKPEWNKYTMAFLNSKIHIIVCGRAGFEYDFVFDDRGNKDLIKTGIKMKVENEFGFEPSLVLDMERYSINKEEIKKLKTRAAKQSYTPKAKQEFEYHCHVLKDRFDLINGETFINPEFEPFEPHFNALNIGGEHVGVDGSRNSEDRFSTNGKQDWQREQTDKKITLEEIQALLVEKYPSRSADDSKQKARIIREVFNTGSWTAVENMPLEKLRSGLERIAVLINPLISTDQMRAIHVLFKEGVDIEDHEMVREQSGAILGIDDLKSMKDLTNEQASKIIKHLKEVTRENKLGKDSPAHE